MIFDGGETYGARILRLTKWHPFFVLWPRKVAESGGRCVCAWLQYVERKGHYHNYAHDSWWSWDYRLQEKMK